MSDEEKIRLTKEWVLTMLYETPKSFQELVEEGCRIMVFGWEYEQFSNIIIAMKNSDKTILENDQKYRLNTKGIFEIKKHVLLPILKITEDPSLLHEFVTAHKEKCDTRFLELLGREEYEAAKISRIKEYAQNNYDKIANAVSLIITFLK